MRRLSLQSPAKVNLYLKVINKRKDGFHNIVTLFERINLFDEILLTANSTGDIRIKCNHPDVPTNSKNLVYQVAEMLKNDFQVKAGVDIKIDKRIPVAAGLAGGSSNAATVLSGLNRLWLLKLDRNQLLTYARKMGSDVAFFLYDTSWALGTERGDKITPLDIPAQLWHILVVPRVKMYSRNVYGALKLQLTRRNDNVNILIRHLRKNDIFDLSHLIENDLESVIIRQAPQLLRLKEKLKSLDIHGGMVSGSGPAVFGLLPGKKEGMKFKSVLQKRFSQVYLVRTF